MDPFVLRSVSPRTLFEPLTIDEVMELVSGTGFSAASYRECLGGGFDGDDTAAFSHFLFSGPVERRDFDLQLHLPGVERLAAAPFRNETYRTSLIATLAEASVRQSRNEMDTSYEGLQEKVRQLSGLGAIPVLIVGDSHSHLYCRRPIRRENWILPLHFLCGGGSALGLNNPNSRTGYGARISALLQTLDRTGWDPAWPIFFKFGQVDTEFVYIFRRIEHEMKTYDTMDFEAFCDRCVSGYIRFLSSTLPERLRKSVSVLSVFPPCLSDEEWAQGYINGHIASLHAGSDLDRIKGAIRELEIPDVFERTRMHRRFNQRLQAALRPAGILYVDDCEDLLLPLGLVDGHFVGSAQGRDHHLDWFAMNPSIVSTLWSRISEVINSRRPLSDSGPEARSRELLPARQSI